MKPLRVAFVLVVFGLLGIGFLHERRRERADPTRLLARTRAEVVDFEPLRLPVADRTLRGVVRTSEGAIAPAVQVFLFPEEAEPGRAEPLHVVFTDADGRFELGELEAKTYGVVLSWPATPPGTLVVDVATTGEVEWTLPPPLQPLEVLPEMRRADLRGHLLAKAPDAGTPPDRADESLAGYEVVLRPAPGVHPLSGAVVLRTRTDEQGAFLFEQAVAEDYVLELLPPWASGGSWPVLDRLPMTHAPENDFAPILRHRTGSVEGRITDLRLRPIEGALVQLWPEAHPGRIWPPHSTNESGGFVIEDLPEGRYVLRLHAGATVTETIFATTTGQRTHLTLPPLDPRAPPQDAPPPE